MVVVLWTGLAVLTSDSVLDIIVDMFVALLDDGNDFTSSNSWSENS